MIELLRLLVGVITFKSWRAKYRRKKYDAIKAQVVERHSDGFGAMILSHRQFDMKDLSSFRQPMYQIAMTDKGDWLLCWRKDLMTEEIGPPKENNQREELNRSMNVETEAAVSPV